MTTVHPVGVSAPYVLSDNAYTRCSGRRAERSRLEWWLDAGGDPAQILTDFLADAGLSRPGRPESGHNNSITSITRERHVDRGACGAAVLISAAAGAAMIGAPPGAATPAPAVPDLVAVVYEHAVPPYAAGPAGRGFALGPWAPSWTPDQHAEAVRRVRAAIARGDAYQVNLVGHASAGYHGDPSGALIRHGDPSRALRRHGDPSGALIRVSTLPGARYGGVLSGDGWAVACASPETLVEVRAGRVVTRPVKGTRPATARGRTELLGSAKERAEHVMIVDLSRNDLGRVARTGTVRVDELFAVRRWCDLWQAESTVSAELAPGVGLADLLRAVCPGASVTGAPKRAALEQIAGLEPVGRGPSMGAFGWVDAERVDLGLTIRTVAVDADRVHVWAGGGITWDSDPAAEVAEAAAKAGPLRAALAGQPLAGQPFAGQPFA